MTKRLFLVLILFTALLCPVSAIGFGYHIIEAKAEADFSAGIFPVALNYQFNFPVPDVIEGSSTELAFRLDNGLDIRKLRQHPDDGRFLNEDNAGFPLEYMVLYDEFNLFYRQSMMLNMMRDFSGKRGQMEKERRQWLNALPDLLSPVLLSSGAADRFSIHPFPHHSRLISLMMRSQEGTE